MKKLENHFGGNTTYFVGTLCINGCQTFTLEEAPAVFKEFMVHEQYQKDVLANLPQPDWEMEGCEVKAEIGASEHCPVEVLSQLARSEDVYVRWIVAGNPETSQECLSDLAKDNGESVLRKVANNPNTPPESLSALAQGDIFCAQIVASNPGTPEKVLGELAMHERWRVRSAVAKNPMTTKDVLFSLSKDGKWMVRSAVSLNPKTPDMVLIELADYDAIVDVRVEAKRALQRRKQEIAQA